jgi:hypothetical protein
MSVSLVSSGHGGGPARHYGRRRRPDQPSGGQHVNADEIRHDLASGQPVGERVATPGGWSDHER